MTLRYIQLTSLLYQTRKKRRSVRAYPTCADPDNFVRVSPTLKTFLVDEGWEDPNTCTTLNGPSSARQRNAIEMAFDGPTSNAGSVAS